MVERQYMQHRHNHELDSPPEHQRIERKIAEDVHEPDEPEDPAPQAKRDVPEEEDEEEVSINAKLCFIHAN